MACCLLYTSFVHKPHGSLDWFDVGGKIVRCPVEVGRAPVIITPGADKYQKSFRLAFDDQRNSGNRAASQANRILFIGYGFNDDHLEQYLCPDLKLTKPTVIVTQTLSDNALKVIMNSKETEVIALCAVPGTGWTRVVNQNGEDLTVTEQLWNLEGFNKGCLLYTSAEGRFIAWSLVPSSFVPVSCSFIFIHPYGGRRRKTQSTDSIAPLQKQGRALPRWWQPCRAWESAKTAGSGPISGATRAQKTPTAR